MNFIVSQQFQNSLFDQDRAFEKLEVINGEAKHVGRIEANKELLLPLTYNGQKTENSGGECKAKNNILFDGFSREMTNKL